MMTDQELIHGMTHTHPVGCTCLGCHVAVALLQRARERDDARLALCEAVADRLDGDVRSVIRTRGWDYLLAKVPETVKCTDCGLVIPATTHRHLCWSCTRQEFGH